MPGVVVGEDSLLWRVSSQGGLKEREAYLLSSSEKGGCIREGGRI